MTNILIIAGEASGDTLGAGFINEYLKLQPDTSFFGLGGDKMASAGVELSYHIRDLAFLGFWEVVKNIRFINKVEKDILERVDKIKPRMAVLIDYPGFNLRLAPKLKQRGIRVFYYISPQVWAWGAKRVGKIKANVDYMATIFEFEKEIYEKADVPVKWVGHPLLDEISVSLNESEFRRQLALNDNDIPIGLFPGSRIQEVGRILPEMLGALKMMMSERPEIKGVIGKAPTLDKSIYKDLIEQSGCKAMIYNGQNYDLMAHARLNLVCSGTATLECAIIGTPMIVVYKTSLVTYLIARNLIRIPHIGMVNVVAGKKIVPELIQGDCQAEKIAGESFKYLDDSQYNNEVQAQLLKIRSKLGETGAARRAAMAAVDVLGR
ncbi:MAG: lipid-A-disaccharide synthase [candidate division Zixibacteria bacterium]|nr:lipid-A-disaccharide synthase [candidate division Zixibacteria bacterium]